ncbi:MAG: hypothetical protein K2Y18_00920 [Alphaproteobacteria bacterium]|jgi:uncharacterized protein YbjT (DUF2867 family)|nr:hypothetical protein [Alphaproteobacteria bacterium]
MTRILVTGVTGNNGGTLLPLLQKEGVEVLAGSTKGVAVNGAPGLAFDFLKPETLTTAFKDFETVFLVLPSNEGPMIEMAQNVVDAAKTYASGR